MILFIFVYLISNWHLLHLSYAEGETEELPEYHHYQHPYQVVGVDAGGADAVVVGADFVVVAAIVGGVVVAGFVAVAK